MVRKVIYSYKILDKYWKERNEAFFSLAKLSVTLAKRFYTTVLYCDKATEAEFKKRGIVFDEIVYLSSLRQVNENNYGLAKILAMQEQTEPYLIIDLDTLLFEPILSNHSITYGYKEADPSKEWGAKYIKQYYLDPYQNFKQDIKIDLDWTVFPSNSLVMVQNPYIVTDSYNKILELIGKDYLKSTVQFYEQMLLYAYLQHENVDVGFIYNNPPVVEQEDLYKVNQALSKKFAHFDYYYRQPSCEILVRELAKKFVS